MRLFFFLCFSYCLAQTNPMNYFCEGRCENPDFAALAVLERQQCPNPVPSYKDLKFGDYYSTEEYFEYTEQTCASRYRILSVLDATSDAFRKKYLGEEYLEAREKLVSPYYRHRPMLIFGKNKNGTIHIDGFEEPSEYFGYPYNSALYMESQSSEFIFFLAESSEIYALRSLGSPYYTVKNLDILDTMFYIDYLLPRMRPDTEAAGKNINELLLRLTKNRAPVKASKIKNGFAALGVINSVRPTTEPEQVNFYELSLGIETVIKNDAKINPTIVIYIDKSHLPPDWKLCSSESYYKRRTPFYFFGDLRDGSLIIDSLASTRDVFAFGDTVYDVSMGIPFEELIAFFLPPNISLEELGFGYCWNGLGYLKFAEIRDGIINGSWLISEPDSLRKAVVEIAEKLVFIDNKRNQRGGKRKEITSSPFLGLYPMPLGGSFRCRNVSWYLAMLPKGIDPNYYKKPCERCKEPFILSKREGVWGRKW